MSNRVRILFRSGLDGSWHSGKAALKAMRACTEAATWISEEDWIGRGHPKFLDKRVIPDAKRLSGIKVLYQISMNSGGGFTSGGGSRLTQAKYLWRALPEAVRRSSRLIITRENRKNAWRHSVANPSKYGWCAEQVPVYAFAWTACPNQTAGAPAPPSDLQIGSLSDLEAQLTRHTSPKKYIPVQMKAKAGNKTYLSSSPAGFSLPSEMVKKAKKHLETKAEEKVKENTKLKIGIWS